MLDMTHSDETPVHAGLVASSVVEALVAGQGTTINELADACNIGRSTFYNRLNKGDWKFTELLTVAEVLNEPFSSFIDGMGGRFLNTASRSAVSGVADNGKSSGVKNGRCSDLVAA